MYGKATSHPHFLQISNVHIIFPETVYNLIATQLLALFTAKSILVYHCLVIDLVLVS